MRNNNMFVLFYFLLSIGDVVLSGDIKADNYTPWWSSCDFCPKCPADTNNYIRLHVSVVVLIGIVLSLMTITIIGLVYATWKFRNTIPGGGVKQYTAPSITIPDYERQTSNCNDDKTPLSQTNNFSGSFNKNESTFTIFDENDFEMKILKKEETVSPKSVEQVTTNHPVHASNKKVPVQHIISPDMMKELCTGVLKKIKRNESASLTELDKLQNECKRGGENLTTRLTHDDTSVSDLEEYDVLPRPVAVNNEDAEEIYQGVYDSPVQNNNWDSMEAYKMPNPSEGQYFNSFYINAREHNFINGP